MSDGPSECSLGEIEVRLAYRPPLATVPLRRFLAAHAVPGVETYDPGTGMHARLVPGPSGPALVRFALPEAPAPVLVRLRLATAGDLEDVVARVRHWLDLDSDPVAVDAALAADPLLEPCVRARPGLRVPGTVDGSELAMLAVLGQQVSLGAARTFAGKLVAALGPQHESGLRVFPDAATVAGAGPERLRSVVGLTAARARTLHAVASALAGGLSLDVGADIAKTRPALLGIPGVGPWTADYVALRALADRDAYLGGDLVLRRALGVRTPAEAERRAEGWRPWRAYALLHLWTREVFS